MAIRDLCSFDAMVTADLASRFLVGTGQTISAGNGRGSTASLRMNSSAQWIQRVVPAHATYGMAFSFKASSLPGSSLQMAGLIENVTTQDSIWLSTTGQLLMCRSNSTVSVLATTSSQVIFPAVQHHVQWLVTCHDTTGTFEVRVDGATVLSGSGVDTKQTGNAWFDSYYLQGCSNTGDFDDLYVWDGSGSLNTGFPGDVRVFSVLPSGAGASTGWTPSTGANYAAVDDATPNTTDYVNGDGTDKDTYAFADIVGSGTVRGAQLAVYGTKVDIGPARGIKAVCRNGGTELLSAEQVLGVGYRFWLTGAFEQDPATSAAWASVAALNTAEFGIVVST